MLNDIDTGGSDSFYPFEIKNSLRCRSGGYAVATPAATGNRTRWDMSVWVKRGDVSKTSGIMGCINQTIYKFNYIEFGADGKLYFILDLGNYNVYYRSEEIFTDSSAWYHVFVSFNSAQINESDRIYAYVNGVKLSFTSYANVIRLGEFTHFPFAGRQMCIGTSADGYSTFDGYLAEFHFIDGGVDGGDRTPNAFGQVHPVTGQWCPKKFNGNHSSLISLPASNGFYLDFSDSSSLESLFANRDGSLQITPVAGSGYSLAQDYTYDASIDTPTNNFSVLESHRGLATLQGANVLVSGKNNGTRRSTFPMTGKTYCEFKVVDAITTFGNTDAGIGLVNEDNTETVSIRVVGNASLCVLRVDTASIVDTPLNGLAGVQPMLMLAYDASNGHVWFGSNGVWANGGNPATGTNPTYTMQSSAKTINAFVQVAVSSAPESPRFSANFGQQPFSYPVPAGFSRLCASDISDTKVVDGGASFAPTKISGNGTIDAYSRLPISASQFQPDLVWCKPVSTGHHALFDSVRGIDRYFSTSNNSAELTDPSLLLSLNPDGVTVDAGKLGLNPGIIYKWKQSTNAGFQIVKVTGKQPNSTTTLQHSLGVPPAFIIAKCLTSNSNPTVYHASLGGNFLMNLNSNGMAIPSVTTWAVNSTSVTHFDSQGGDFIYYLFAEVPGFSKFGTYTPASNQQTFVNLGFKPALVICKNYSSTSGDNAPWVMFDTAQTPFNQAWKHLYANSNANQNALSGNAISMYSNGFRIDTTDWAIHEIGRSFLYIAFAESPIKYATAR